MAKPAFLAAPDSVATLATLSYSSQDANYPASNAVALPIAGGIPISNPWRTTGIMSEYIELDLGSAKSISCLGLFNHNYSSGATITLKGGASANPSTFTQVLTWRQYDAFALFATQSYRYWRITIVDTGNTNAYLSLGYILLGAYTQMAVGFAYGAPFNDVYTNLQVNTEFNVPHIAPLAYQIQFPSITFNALSDTDMNIIRAHFKNCQKNVYPFLWIPDSAVNDGYLVRFVNDLSRMMDVWRTTTVSLIEDSRGKAIGA